jgi:hypothetical protein
MARGGTDAGSARARLTTERRGKRGDRGGTQGKATRPRGQLDRLHARKVPRRRRAAARGHVGPPRRPLRLAWARCTAPRCAEPPKARVGPHGVALTSVHRTPPWAPRSRAAERGRALRQSATRSTPVPIFISFAQIQKYITP